MINISNIPSHVLFNFLNSLRKRDKMLCKPHILSLNEFYKFNRLEHSCKILYFICMCCGRPLVKGTSALDKLLGQLGIYAAWLSSIAYLQNQLRIFIFFLRHVFFPVITRFLIA